MDWRRPRSASGARRPPSRVTSGADSELSEPPKPAVSAGPKGRRRERDSGAPMSCPRDSPLGGRSRPATIGAAGAPGDSTAVPGARGGPGISRAPRFSGWKRLGRHGRSTSKLVETRRPAACVPMDDSAGFRPSAGRFGALSNHPAVDRGGSRAGVPSPSGPDAPKMRSWRIEADSTGPFLGGGRHRAGHPGEPRRPKHPRLSA